LFVVPTQHGRATLLPRQQRLRRKAGAKLLLFLVSRKFSVGFFSFSPSFFVFFTNETFFSRLFRLFRRFILYLCIPKLEYCKRYEEKE
jgi:hypothetical protein